MDKRASHGSDKDILDYYHSPLAGQGPFYQLARHTRQLSTISSSSSSEYSNVSESRDATSTTSSSDVSSEVTRQSSTRSLAGGGGGSGSGGDQRRYAIVQMDPPVEENIKSLTASQFQSSHAHRRAVLSLDIAHTTTTTTTTTNQPAPVSSKPDPAVVLHQVHQRSASETNPSRKKQPRDIGIVGTAQLTSGAKQQGTPTDKILPNIHTTNNITLHPPIFQQPKSSSPSPEPSPEPTRSTHSATPVRGLSIMKHDRLGEPPSRSATLPPSAFKAPSPQPPPEKGDEKCVHVPVAETVSGGIDSVPDAIAGGIRLVTQPKHSASSPIPTPTSTVATTNATLPLTLGPPNASPTISYANYQPGVHSTAGPLPPPPRLPGFESSSASPLSPPPPRPPRLNSPLPPRHAARSKDLEAVKQALQLPPSVSAALASRTPAPAEPVRVSQTTARPKTAHTDSHAPPPAAVVARAESSTGHTIPPSPSISDSSTSSYSMVQNLPSSHRREGAFPPSSSDVGSEPKENEIEKDSSTQKRALSLDTAVASACRSDNDDTIPQVTIISEPPLLPSPILEEPPTEQHPQLRQRFAADDNNDSLRPRHRRELGQVVVTSDNEDDSNENWIAISRLSSPSPSTSTTTHHDRSTSLDHHQHRMGNNNNGIDRESGSRTSSEAPSPPPKSFRNSLTTGLKRFSSRSLPRTPSVSSGGSRRSSSVMSKRLSTGSANLGGGSGSVNLSSANASNGGSRPDVNRTPSPLASLASPVSPPPRQPTRAATVHGHGVVTGGNGSGVVGGSISLHGHGTKVVRPARQKIIVQWPSAMFCNEIHVKGKKKLSTGERCAIYAQKINELNMYDCGLTTWVVDMRCRGPNSNLPGGSVNKKSLDARSPASAPFTPQPRQTSRSSMVSDATFPTRADATTATDLLFSSHDDHADVYREDVPVLPYPSLATQQRAAASNVVNANASAATTGSPNISATSMTPPASIRSLGSASNSTLPSMGGGGGSNNTHTHAHSYSYSATLQLPPSNITTSFTTTPIQVSLSPIPPSRHNSIASPTATGFFASLGRKASLSSAKRPNLGLGGLSNLISSPVSTSPSNGLLGSLSTPTPHRALLTKSAPSKSVTAGGMNGGGSNVKQPVNVGGIQMNPSTPPSVTPYGPRAPPGSTSSSNGMGRHDNHRVQRSKTFMPSSSSPFSTFGTGGGNSGGNNSAPGSSAYGNNAGIERRPSLWELSINTTASGGGSSSPATGMASPISGSSTPTATMFNHINPNTLVHNYNSGAAYVAPPPHHSQPYTPPQYNPHPVPHHHQSHTPQQKQQQPYDPHSNPEFIRQVDKLADLLPHADRLVLAGYLKRAGQDVLAIGQYLEDEKNGLLKPY